LAELFLGKWLGIFGHVDLVENVENLVELDMDLSFVGH
jgi:hypothetical protein